MSTYIHTSHGIVLFTNFPLFCMQCSNISEEDSFLLIISSTVCIEYWSSYTLTNTTDSLGSLSEKKKFTFKCHHLLTMCEHYSVNMHMWIIVFKYIPPFMSMYNECVCTCTCTTVVLASYQVPPSVNNVWTLQCEHPYVNYLPYIHSTLHVHVQCMYM